MQKFCTLISVLEEVEYSPAFIADFVVNNHGNAHAHR